MQTSGFKPGFYGVLVFLLCAQACAQQQINPATQIRGVSGTPTGTGALVLQSSPSLITPVLGVASGTSLTLSASSPLTLSNTVATITGGGATGSTFLSNSDQTSSVGVFGSGNTGQIRLNAGGVNTVIIGPGGAQVTQTFQVLGHTIFEGVTSTGATGTGKLVYDTNATIGATSVTTGTLQATNIQDGSGNLITGTATLSVTGCGTGATIQGTNSAAFKVVPGTGLPLTCQVNLPTAANGWACSCNNISQVAVSDMIVSAQTTIAVLVKQYAHGTSTQQFLNSGDVLLFQCAAF